MLFFLFFSFFSSKLCFFSLLVKRSWSQVCFDYMSDILKTVWNIIEQDFIRLVSRWSRFYGYSFLRLCPEYTVQHSLLALVFNVQLSLRSSLLKKFLFLSTKFHITFPPCGHWQFQCGSLKFSAVVKTTLKFSTYFSGPSGLKCRSFMELNFITSRISRFQSVHSTSQSILHVVLILLTLPAIIAPTSSLPI